MKRSRPLSAVMVAAACWVSGCAAGKQLVSSREDYRLYRATRVAPTLEERLAAGHRYLKRAPDGQYAGEIRAWFLPAERAYVARAHASLPMLRAYLAGLPDGPSSAAVRARAEELEATRAFATRRSQRRTERVSELESGFERAAAQRKAFLQSVGSYVAALSAIETYGQPLSALPPALAATLGAGDAAACSVRLCSKPVEQRFAIPHSERRLLPRDASCSVELALAAGALAGARIRGRELLSRIGEGVDLKPVSFAEPLSRAEAIGTGLAVVQNALGGRLSGAECERAAVSPIVLERVCAGVRLTVTAAVEPGADDIVMFEPETPVSAPDASKKPALPAKSEP